MRTGRQTVRTGAYDSDIKVELQSPLLGEPAVQFTYRLRH